MARIRSLKPDFFDDEDLAELPFWARILFEGLWCHADKEGRLEDRPLKLKAQIFPYDKRVDVEHGLELLTDPKKHSPQHPPFIVRYEVNGGRYIQILSWEKHQSPHHTEKDSEIPPFNGALTVKEPLLKGAGRSQHYPISDPISDPSKKEGPVNVVAEVVSYLNEKTGKRFNPKTKETAALIRARASEGHGFEDFKKVVDVKVAKWKGDPKMDDFLRPSTLFRPTHFEEYLNEDIPRRRARAGENTKPESAEAAYRLDRRNAYEEKLWAEKAEEIERIRTTVPRSQVRDAMGRIESEIRCQVADWVNSGMPEDQKHGGPS